MITVKILQKKKHIYVSHDLRST